MSDHPTKMHKKVKQRYGSAIEHGRAHDKAHSNCSRRDFLRNAGLAALGGGLMLGAHPVNALMASPLIAGLSAADADRILVLIRLKGGNDGLNTVVLRDNDEYYNIRPNIALQEADIFGLTTEFGMPNVMSDLQAFWNEGRMKIIHNVGYPDANYSHFRSSDIWASASDSDEVVKTGWIGRFMDFEFPAFLDAAPTMPPALQIGVRTNLVFQGPAANMALSISNPTEFYQIAQSGQLYDTSQLGNCSSDLELAYLRQNANSAFRYSETIKQAYNRGKNEVQYPDTNLSEQMSIVARLIKGDLGTKVYMVDIGGFDTHADQYDNHLELLNAISTAVDNFFKDIDKAGLSNKVLAMTFSEFGRTIFENGSFGTDHGTGGPILLFSGDALGNGFVGDPPDLLNPDMYGDPPFSVDFRSVYASVLNGWLGLAPEVTDYVMGKPTDTINGLVPDAGPNSLPETAVLLGHNPSSIPALGDHEIKYSILRRGTVRLQITDKAGQPLRMLVNEFKEKGSYTFRFSRSQFYLQPGEYLYKLESGGKVYGRGIRL